MTNSPEYAEDKLPYYKVLIHRDDYESIRLPPTEAHLIAENAEVSPADPFRRDFTNQDFKRFKISEIGGFDIEKVEIQMRHRMKKEREKYF